MNILNWKLPILAATCTSNLNWKILNIAKILYLGTSKWQLLMKMADLQKREEKLEMYLFH